MIRLSRSEYSTQNVSSQIQEIVKDLKKDLLGFQSEPGKKSKQVNKYDKFVRMTKQEYQKLADKNEQLKLQQQLQQLLLLLLQAKQQLPQPQLQ